MKEINDEYIINEAKRGKLFNRDRYDNFNIFNDKITKSYNSIETDGDNNYRQVNVYLKDGRWYHHVDRKRTYIKNSEVYSIRGENDTVIAIYPKSEYVYTGNKTVGEIEETKKDIVINKELITKDMVLKDLENDRNSFSKFLGVIFIVIIALNACVYKNSFIPLLVASPLILYILFITTKVNKDIYVEVCKINEITYNRYKGADVVLENGEYRNNVFYKGKKGNIGNGDDVFVIKSLKKKKIEAIYSKNEYDIKL